MIFTTGAINHNIIISLDLYNIVLSKLSISLAYNMNSYWRYLIFWYSYCVGSSNFWLVIMGCDRLLQFFNYK